MPSPTTPDRRPPDELVSRMGRFDESFFVRMVVGFLGLTVLVAGLELGLRYGALLWDFHRTDRVAAEVRAEVLAADVRSIMINEGGPVAARTIYPILERNFRQAGYEVAVIPSEQTEEAIERAYGFTPQGIAANWPEGTFNEGSVPVRADQVCLTCHMGAERGDVLGTVVVRDYLDRRLEGWWDDLRLTATVNLATAGVHTIILFLLLRTLMAPLLSLRSAVSRLGKGTSGLRIRAPVASADEFGELAHDLNAFLDRVANLMEELRRNTDRSVKLNQRLSQMSHQTRKQVEVVERSVREALPKDRESWVRAGDWSVEFPRILGELYELRHHIQGIESLEERLDDVSDDGRRLLDRLLDDEEGAAGREEGTAGKPGDDGSEASEPL